MSTADWPGWEGEGGNQDDTENRPGKEGQSLVSKQPPHVTHQVWDVGGADREPTPSLGWSALRSSVTVLSISDLRKAWAHRAS